MNSEIKEAFENYFSALRKLRELGVSKNQRDFTSKLGEWLVEVVFDGKRSESGIQKFWDVEAGSEKIQVKTHAKAENTTARWSAIKYDENAETTSVIIIVFSSDYKLKEFYKVPWTECIKLISRNKDRDVLNWNKLKDYNENFRELPKQDILSIFY